MSYYVGPERFEPTQRDAQWRRRCNGEVYSYAAYRKDGVTKGRGRDPIMGDGEIHKQKFMVTPNPEKIGAVNAADFEAEKSLALEKRRLQKKGFFGGEEASKLQDEAASGEAVPILGIKSSDDGAGSVVSSRLSGSQRSGSARGPSGARKAQLAIAARPSSVGTASTLSGAGSVSIMSSSRGSGSARGPGNAQARMRYPLTSPPPNSGSGTASEDLRSSSSMRSSVLYEALGEETKRRVEAEKEVQRLATLLEEANGKISAA